MADPAADASGDTESKLLDDVKLEIKSFERRDKILALEAEVQKLWDEKKAFEVDAGEPGQEKFLVTFPYPYMNGILHLGHAFTLTKAEFAAGFQRLLGKKVLFPFGFHCTGMPIAAAAQKIKREIETYGNPPKFPEEKEDGKDAAAETDSSEAGAAADKGGKKKDAVKKKGKVASKKSKKKYQWEILEELKVPSDKIAEFADPVTWLKYFPPIAEDHLKRFGLKVDWRRSFVTTSLNPYYDAFIRWQFNSLKKLGLIDFGKRASIFSLLDNQVCADHDRASGEGVNPQEYTGIKLQLLDFPKSLDSIPADLREKVFLVAATLRPETMYGQTNCWILPRGEYGAYKTLSGEVFIISQRAALNMSCQDFFEFGKPEKLADVAGWDLLGKAVKAPNSSYPKVYVMPLTTISMDKGTGIVTSVPSDSPADFTALEDLRKSEELRKKYYITAEMIEPYEIIPIIDIPDYGTLAAPKVCKDLGVKNQEDVAKLEQAKDIVYKNGFFKGTMIIGPHKGLAVQKAKPIIQKELVERKDAIIYSEPESKVVSRSGDECVVALIAQWYLKYGQEDWQKAIHDWVDSSNFDTYNPAAKTLFLNTIDWLHEWACSRNFGLGTFVPWDPKFVIESLSDSTIYMAYYTISHFLQQGTLEGSVVGPAGIKADQLTDEVFDYVFLRNPEYPASAGIKKEVLDKLRKEFSFWYPVDLRVSGKDLIGNHLVMSLYNHAAMWRDRPEFWPKSFFTNGHAMLNGEKMSKSTGNFLTLADAMDLFGADATRFALADAGDGLEDANFTLLTANSAVLRLSTEADWIKEVMATFSTLRSDGGKVGESAFLDNLFLNDIARSVNETYNAYKNIQFRSGLKSGYYDLQTSRNFYRASCTEGMNKDVVMKYLEVSIILISPICPHWAQKMWETIGKSGLVIDAKWPEVQPVDPQLYSISNYIQDISYKLRLGLQQLSKTKGKGGKGKAEAAPEEKKPPVLYVYIAPNYPDWQKNVLIYLKKYSDEHKEMPAKDKLIEDLKSTPGMPPVKDFMSFSSYVIKQHATLGDAALLTEAPFDELALVRDRIDVITRGLAVSSVEIYSKEDPKAVDPLKKKDQANPLSPSFAFKQEK